MSRSSKLNSRSAHSHDDDDDGYVRENVRQQQLLKEPSEQRLAELVDALQQEPLLRFDRNKAVSLVDRYRCTLCNMLACLHRVCAQLITVNVLAKFIRETSDAAFSTAFRAWAEVSCVFRRAYAAQNTFDCLMLCAQNLEVVARRDTREEEAVKAATAELVKAIGKVKRLQEDYQQLGWQVCGRDRRLKSFYYCFLLLIISDLQKK